MKLRRRVRVQFVGFVDAVLGSSIRGWAADPNASDDVLDIEIIARGRSIGQGKADQFRPDLLAAGYGRGNHGFSIRLSELLHPGASLEILASKAGATRARKALPTNPILGIQIARSYYSGLQSVQLPEDVYGTCKQVGEGKFSIPKGAPTGAERLYFSDELFMHTLVAFAERP